MLQKYKYNFIPSHMHTHTTLTQTPVYSRTDTQTESLGPWVCDLSQLFTSQSNVINCNRCDMILMQSMTFMKVTSMDDWRQLHGLFLYWISSKVVQPHRSPIPIGGTSCPCVSWDGTPRHGWSSLGLSCFAVVAITCKIQTHPTANLDTTAVPKTHLHTRPIAQVASFSAWNMLAVPLPVQQMSQTDQCPTAITVYLK